MSLATRSLPGRIEPFRLFFGAGECTQITTVADSSGSLNDTYWEFSVPASLFNSTKLAVDYYVWYNINAAGTDPALAGKVGIEVTAATDATAETIALNTQTAIDALSPQRVNSSLSGSVLTIENREMGVTTAAADGAVPTGFTISQLSAGFGGDFGATTQDGAEISYESETVPITSLQTGNLILDQFYLGGAINLSVGLQEMDIETWDLALRSTGSSFTPPGGTQVAGIGEATLFRSFLATGGQLTLKPLSTAADDNSRNQTFWRAAPQPESVNFNNDIQALQVTFQALLDPSKDTRINSYMFGDQDQEGLQS